MTQCDRELKSQDSTIDIITDKGQVSVRPCCLSIHRSWTFLDCSTVKILAFWHLHPYMAFRVKMERKKKKEGRKRGRGGKEGRREEKRERGREQLVNN